MRMSCAHSYGFFSLERALRRTLIRACAQVIFEEWRKEVVAMLAVYGMAMRVVVVKFVAT